MRIIIVDYSDHYSKIAGFSVPDKYTGKFVQIRHKDKEYLIFSPKEFKKYHAEIVEHFAEQMGLAGSYDSEKKIYNIFEPEWKIIGGGKFEIDRKEKVLRLYDDSMAYGRFNEEGLVYRLTGSGEFSGYRIVID